MGITLSKNYIVQKGDWLSKIARKMLKSEGDTSISAQEILSRCEDIAAHNKIDCLDCIFEGQTLDLSPWLETETAITHTRETVTPLSHLPTLAPQPVRLEETLAKDTTPLTTDNRVVLQESTPLPPTHQAETIPTEEVVEAQKDNTSPELIPTVDIPSAWHLPEEERTIVFVKGHGGQDPGAVLEKYTERDFINPTTDRQMAVLKANGYNVIEIDTSGSQKLSLDARRDLKEQYPNTPIIYNHYNVANNKANGSETWYTSNGAKDLAHFVQQELDGISYRHGVKTNRGVKYTDNMRVLSTIDMNGDNIINLKDESQDLSILVEYDFIDNPTIQQKLIEGLNDPNGNNYLTQKADAAAAGIAHFIHQRHDEQSQLGTIT